MSKYEGNAYVEGSFDLTYEVYGFCPLNFCGL